MSDLPRNGEAVTAEWLARVMRPALGPVRIDAVAAAPLEDAPSYNGTFSLAALFASDASSDLPVSVVVKMVPANPAILALGRQLDVYRREAAFYRDIGAAAGVRIPRCYGIETDVETGDAAIVLEDLTHLRTGNQYAGFARTEVELAVTQYTAMHARWWNSDALRDYPWLPAWNAPAAVAYITNAYREVWPRCLQLFEELIGPEARALGEGLGRSLPALMEHAGTGPVTLLHGDARHDNLMFAGDGSPPHVIDWQFAARGRAMVDIAYYLCQGGDSTLVAAIERELVGSYHDALMQAGVKEYSFDACWSDYRRFAAYTVVYPVFAAALMDPASTQQREAVAIILDRALAAALRLDGAEFLDR